MAYCKTVLNYLKCLNIGTPNTVYFHFCKTGLNYPKVRLSWKSNVLGVHTFISTS